MSATLVPTHQGHPNPGDQTGSVTDHASELGNGHVDTRRRLHLFQWIVLATLVTITVFSADVVSDRSNEHAEAAFEDESSRTADLIVDRLKRYEISLWAGVGLIEAMPADQPLTRDNWIRFAENLDLPGKYPGINGIGVIYRVDHADVDQYVAAFSSDYPEIDEFGPKPFVDTDVHFPITFIEPFKGNEEAVGLDMAFEANRFAGAQAAFRSSTAQITGPIVLVQDDDRTPGFLFFAPFDEDTGNGGLVYAPFVARRLMDGALNVDQRDVVISITDGGTTLYSERNDEVAGYDPDPMFTKNIELDVHGRSWDVEVASNLSFRAQATNREPLIILLTGGILNALLFGLFVNNLRARRRTADYADEVTVELRNTLSKLEQTNADLNLTNQDLEQFAYVASHDLQTPMRTVSNYASLLAEELEGEISDEHRRYLRSLVTASDRMQVMIRSVLDYATLNRWESGELVDLSEVVADVLGELEAEISTVDARIVVARLPVVCGSRDGLVMAFRNLIGNALKYTRNDTPPEIQITYTPSENETRIGVSDNGIGIEPEYRAKVFQLFYRLNPVNKYDGTGIGLAMCKRIIEASGGSIEVSTNPAGGTTFTVVLPAAVRSATPAEVSSESAVPALR